MMWHCLHSAQEMDQVDAQQSISTSADYETKKERREMVMEGKGQPSTKSMTSMDHSKAQLQHEKLSHQLLDRVQ